MDALNTINAVLEQIDKKNRTELNDATTACREFLEGCDFYVCADDDELREKALKITDLVDPGEQ